MKHLNRELVRAFWKIDRCEDIDALSETYTLRNSICSNAKFQSPIRQDGIRSNTSATKTEERNPRK